MFYLQLLVPKSSKQLNLVTVVVSAGVVTHPNQRSLTVVPDLRRLTAKKEVILSAGAINSPQILLHSGIGDGVELRNLGIKSLHSLPDVGRNMVDQPYVPIVWAVNSTVAPYVSCALMKQSYDAILPTGLTQPLPWMNGNRTIQDPSQ